MFKFPLQRVLDLRAKREQEVAAQLAHARAGAEEAQRARASLQDVRSQGAARLAAAQAAPNTIGQLQNLAFVLDRLDQRITESEQTVLAAEDGVRRRMDEFSAAFQDRRVLDRLRERHREAWQVEEVRLDREAMDDIALSRFAQRASAAGRADG